MKFKDLHKAIKERDLNVGDSFWIDEFEFEVKRNRLQEEMEKTFLYVNRENLPN
jgi:hypothetical protein